VSRAGSWGPRGAAGSQAIESALFCRSWSISPDLDGTQRNQQGIHPRPRGCRQIIRVDACASCSWPRSRVGGRRTPEHHALGLTPCPDRRGTPRRRDYASRGARTAVTGRACESHCSSCCQRCDRRWPNDWQRRHSATPHRHARRPAPGPPSALGNVTPSSCAAANRRSAPLLHLGPGSARLVHLPCDGHGAASCAS
jgi:hypothetical protein